MLLEKLRAMSRRKLLVLLISLSVIGKLLDLTGMSEPLANANGSVQAALEAIDPFVAVYHFNKRFGDCRYDWRFQCLCPAWRQLPPDPVFPGQYPRFRENPPGCVWKEPLWPFNWSADGRVPVLSAITGIPDATIYTAQQVLAQSWLALALLGLTTLFGVFFTFQFFLDMVRTEENPLKLGWFLCLAPFFALLVGGLLAFLLKWFFLGLTWIFGKAMAMLMLVLTLVESVTKPVQTVKEVRFLITQVRRWRRSKKGSA